MAVGGSGRKRLFELDLIQSAGLLGSESHGTAQKRKKAKPEIPQGHIAPPERENGTHVELVSVWTAQKARL